MVKEEEEEVERQASNKVEEKIEVVVEVEDRAAMHTKLHFSWKSYRDEARW